MTIEFWWSGKIADGSVRINFPEIIASDIEFKRIMKLVNIFREAHSPYCLSGLLQFFYDEGILAERYSADYRAQF